MADGNRGNRLKTGTIAAHQAMMFDKLLSHTVDSSDKHEKWKRDLNEGHCCEGI